MPPWIFFSLVLSKGIAEGVADTAMLNELCSAIVERLMRFEARYIDKCLKTWHKFQAVLSDLLAKSGDKLDGAVCNLAFSRFLGSCGGLAGPRAAWSRLHVPDGHLS